MKIAFVLGNGVSRKQIKTEKLKVHGTVYGCNALYREFSPDHLICVDTKMVNEIVAAGYEKNNKVWSNPNKLTTKLPNINLMNPNKGWSSGPTAMLLASQHQHDVIYILGFDYVGIGNNNETVNNVYAGTKNYKNVQDRATYYGNWTRQTMMCAGLFPRVKYIRLIEKESSFIPDHLKNIPNLSHMLIENFKKDFN